MSTLRQMSYWLAVVEEGSFTRAADRMHVSQPSLSQQIRSLEAELGGELLERLPRSVRLTAAGKAFLPHARMAVRAAERAMRSARSALQMETGELEISTVRSIAAGLLPDLIKAWRKERPGTTIRLHEMTHRAMSEEAVRDGLADIGIGPPPLEWMGLVERLGWEEFVVVLARDDPLAKRQSIPLSSLAQRLWVMFHPDNGLSDMLIAACAFSSTQFVPQAAVLTSQVETAARLAAAGVGPALVPINTIPRGLNGAILRVEPPVGRELAVYTRTRWPALGEAFVELMKNTAWPNAPEDANIIA
ncbi:MAG TPA: LysR family transcriptional regulator [Solirubrobacterales bacterium]|nr:LysR family transcriptional regulator [Solirubrobacterales bacterium]